MELPDRTVCYRALQSRDARFDGLLFTGVASTGIYCRPICPARCPNLENCRFFNSAAAAQEAGFRPCLRCRPETAPDLASWRGTSNTVSRAVALISEGGLDGDGTTVESLAERLGVGERQLRRLFQQHLGATPIAVAQTRRVLFAKQLIHETQMPMTEVALASGFGSLRRFHETFRTLFGRPPSALRKSSTQPVSSKEGITLRLRYRPPYDWPAILQHLSARAIPGVESVRNGVYNRTIAINNATGYISVSHLPREHCLSVTIHFPEVTALPVIVSRVRSQFDLGADIETIGLHLSRDPLLAPLLSERPGLRVPGAWDGFELGIRAVLGQQISVASAAQLAGRLVAQYGSPAHAPVAGWEGLTHVFPSPGQLLSHASLSLPMPAVRQSCLRALAVAAAGDPYLFKPLATLEAAVARLQAIEGVGEWTAQYIALRALRNTDAFPASDVALIRSAAQLAGVPLRAATLLQRAECWRPWRAYAAQHLWAADPKTHLTARKTA